MPAGQSIPGASAIIWDQPNAGGPTGSGIAAIAGTGLSGTNPAARYDAWDYDRLVNFNSWGGLAGIISSVSLFTPITGATVVILYAYAPGFLYNATHFDYSFLLLDNQSGDRWDVNLADIPFQDGTWDNCASSMIVVHTAQGPEVRLSASTSLTPTWNSFIDPQLANAADGAVTGISRSGNPSWRWVAFPKDKEFLSANGNYLSAHQGLHISLEDPLPDYDASLTYYLRLFVSNSTVTGFVKRFEYWVEPGLMHDFVKAVLRPYVMLGAERLNDVLAGGGVLPAGLSVQRLYYLPGNQRDATKKGERQIFKGFTDGDATIVLQTG